MYGSESSDKVISLPGEVPAEHRAVFDAINNEVTQAHAIWNLFKQLFANKEAVATLNKAAGGCARFMQDALLDDVMLSLSRLTDPLKSGPSRENLVLERLRTMVSASDERQRQLSLELDCALMSVVSACKVLREHRNKRIAHLDLGTALESHALPPWSVDIIEAAFIHVCEALNTVNNFYRGGPTIYAAVSMNGDGAALIRCLRDGLRFRYIQRIAFRLSPDELRDQVLLREW